MNIILYSLKIPGVFGAKRDYVATQRWLRMQVVNIWEQNTALCVPKGQHETLSLWPACPSRPQAAHAHSLAACINPIVA